MKGVDLIIVKTSGSVNIFNCFDSFVPFIIILVRIINNQGNWREKALVPFMIPVHSVSSEASQSLSGPQLH